MNGVPQGQPPQIAPKKRMGMGAKLAIGCGGCFGLFVLVVIIVGVTAHSVSDSSSSQSIPQAGALTSENERAVMRMEAQSDLERWARGEKMNYINLADVTEVIRVSADKLQRDYSANEVNADLNYKDKNLIVTGIVSSIDRSIGSNYFLSLRGGDNMFMSPHAQMADGFVNYLAGLKKGQQVTLYGKCEGMLMGSATLTECKPIEDWAKSAAENYTAKYVDTLPNIIKNKYLDGLRLGVVSTATVSVLSSPDAFTTGSSDKEKHAKAMIESGVMKIVLEEGMSDGALQKGFKKYGVNNKQDYINAIVSDFAKQMKPQLSESDKIDRSDFASNLFVKDPDGNEITVIEEACKKYGLSPSEVRSLLVPNKTN